MLTARRNQSMIFVLALVSFASAGFSGNALAQLTDPSGSFNGLLDLVQNSAASWDGRLRGYATTLFWLLASIQFVWTFFPLIFRQADFGEVVGELIRFILVIGFFYALLMFSAEWGRAVVNSFREAGSHAVGMSGAGLKPGVVFAAAVDLANTIGDVETLNPLTAVMISLSAIIVLLCFAFIAAFMGVTLVESYLVINASVIFMGFGGSQWTREYALAMVRYAVSVGAKLFVLTLIVGLILDSAKQWAAAYGADDTSMWTMVGLSLVCAYLAKTVPELVAGMINGSSMGGGSTLGGMAAAGAAGATAAIATIATAGAAAPAAVGALGAGGGAGGAGGLAGALNSSIAGHMGAGIGAAAAKSGLGAATGGANAAGTTATKVGGNLGASLAHPTSAQSTSAVQQASKQAAKPSAPQDEATAQAVDPADTSAEAPSAGLTNTTAAADNSEGPTAAQGGITGLQMASGMTRATGILAAISVPGMDSAAGLSLGQGAPRVDGPAADSDSSDFRNDTKNIITPSTPNGGKP